MELIQRTLSAVSHIDQILGPGMDMTDFRYVYPGTAMQDINAALAPFQPTQ